ncbi:MAG: pseudouridine synthase [Bacillota bacterium]
MERLHKFMARNGIAARRACEEIIAAGRVKVNGETVTKPGTTIDPQKDTVQVDGRRLKAPEEYIYMMLYKPRGYISAVSDPRGRKTVIDLLEGTTERLYPVGRLDYNSEGLLLLTNDGDFAQKVSHPGHKIPKTYRVRVKGIPTVRNLDILSSGVMLDDGMTAPAQVYIIDEKEGNALLEITISEGRNRQVRRMLEKIGHEVLRLKRTKIGALSLANLRAGETRHLKESEIKSLLKLASTEKKTAIKRIRNYSTGG